MDTMVIETWLMIGGALVLAMISLFMLGMVGLGAVVAVGIAGLGATIYGVLEGGLEGLGLEIATETLQMIPLLGL